MKNCLINYSANIDNPKWEQMISRETPIYKREHDIRSEFERDYTRILHSNAHRRLKHKTQVFFSPTNDHICTRSEHANHVESISYTIAKYLGLNTELTKAISNAHDLGHSPFGHQGEKILSKISQKDLGYAFWHEQNGLNFVDDVELLEDNYGNKQNLNLTYAVRDGIISHCGEIDENALRPREDFISLDTYCFPNQFAPFTWEACVVKISDKISYIGRDIEDAISIGIIDDHLEELYDLLRYSNKRNLNNGIIINDLIYDLCQNSSYENGLRFSDNSLYILNEIKKFNYEYIYLHKKTLAPNNYFSLVLNTIYETLKNTFNGISTLKELHKLSKYYPNLACNFKEWLENYWNLRGENNKLKNKIIFNMENEKDFYKAIILYISGMTDNYAMEIFNEIISF